MYYLILLAILFVINIKPLAFAQNKSSDATTLNKITQPEIESSNTKEVISFEPSSKHKFTTKASKYSSKLSGKKTASGQPYNPNQLTAASKTLPLGSKVLVQNPRNGKTCIVKINDRGPYVKGRGLDLSKAAAKKIEFKGVGQVICYPNKHTNKLKSTLK